METPLATPALAASGLPDAQAQHPPGALGRLAALPLRTRLALGAATGVLALAIAGGVALGRQSEWRVLYANLGDKEGGQVIAALTQLNVPHRFTEGGGAIMVPAQQVHETRLRLASQGLPKGGTVGYELMENQKFGTTQFQERLNFQRGLEGELARSIMALSAVQSARVHLALPQPTAFLREQHKPSASVLLALHGGRTLDRAQISGIVHLVASSVADLHPRAVSVVDETGSLLSQPPGESPNGLDAGQLQHVRQTEQGLAARVVAIIEPIVGPGNVKAQVTADVDFTQSESTAETYAPNQGQAPAAVRSQHLSENAGPAPQPAAGVPGALSNQPPGTAPSTVNGPAPALGAGGAAAAAAGAASKRDAVTNYEVDKTVKVVRNASGTVRRLSAAVVVNHASVTGPDGKPSGKPLSAEQMAQIEALAREAVGFSKERGDSLNVVNAPFRTAELPQEEPLPPWMQPQLRQLARELAPWIAMPLVALIVVFGLVRPTLRQARRAGREALAPARLIDATVQDPVDLPAPMDASQGGAVPLAAPDAGADVPLLPTAQAAAQQGRARQLEHIRHLAKQNPATIANVVRNWVGTPAT